MNAARPPPTAASGVSRLPSSPATSAPAVVSKARSVPRRTNVCPFPDSLRSWYTCSLSGEIAMLLDAIAVLNPNPLLPVKVSVPPGI